MGLRERMGATADRLISKYGDTQQIVAIVTTPGATEFDAPSIAETTTDVKAVVTGVRQWEVSETVLASDLHVLVSGEAPSVAVGGVIKIDGDNHTVIQARKMLAAGYASAVKYTVRRG